MKSFCLNLITIGIASGIMVLILLIVRIILRKMGARKKWMLFLWTLLAVRLLLPASLATPIGLIPSGEALLGIRETGLSEYSGNGAQTETPQKNAARHDEPAALPGSDPVGHFETENQSIPYRFLVIVYGAGVFGLILYYAVNYLILSRKLRFSWPLEGSPGVYLSDRVRTPFVFGFVRERIYLPFGLSEEQMKYVLRHERIHLKYKDALWKTVAFVLLAVYWYHPLIWLAYFVFARDLEMVCDERTVEEWGEEEKRTYAKVLYDMGCENGRGAYLRASLAENSIKERIVAILDRRKKLILPSVLIVAVFLIGSACLFVSSNEQSPPSENESDVRASSENHAKLERAMALMKSLEEEEKNSPLLFKGTNVWEATVDPKNEEDAEEYNKLEHERQARISAYHEVIDIYTTLYLYGTDEAMKFIYFGDEDIDSEFYLSEIDRAYEGLERLGVTVVRPEK